jgi:EamA domain-containing membrane protein RarD
VDEGEGMKTIGNVLAVASVIAASLLALYGVNMAVRSSRELAWVAVGLCVAWFASLALRHARKEVNNGE